MKSTKPATTLPIQVSKDHEAMSRSAARLIFTELVAKPNLVLCASAGGTPARTYDLLAAGYARQPRAFRQLRVLQIDE